MTAIYQVGDEVIVDNDQANKVTVIGVCDRGGGWYEYDCAAWVNGDQKMFWLPTWRLKALAAS